MTRRGMAILFVAAVTISGCRAAPEDEGPTDGSEPAAESQTTPPAAPPAASSSPTRAALPGLFSIMAALEGDMARISRGLWAEDLEMVAAGADAVADHPRVPPEEFERISSVLGPEMSDFGAMDGRVHDLAVRMAEEARRGNLDAVLATDAELRQGCVSCHTAFRDRLRREIR